MDGIIKCPKCGNQITTEDGEGYCTTCDFTIYDDDWDDADILCGDSEDD